MSGPRAFLADPGRESVLADGLFVALVGAYPITVVFGVPLFLLIYPFTPRIGFGPTMPVLAGSALAALGIWLVQAMDHPVTAEGYTLVAGNGVLGAGAGWLFRLIAVGSDPRWRARRRRLENPPFIRSRAGRPPSSQTLDAGGEGPGAPP